MSKYQFNKYSHVDNSIKTVHSKCSKHFDESQSAYSALWQCMCGYAGCFLLTLSRCVFAPIPYHWSSSHFWPLAVVHCTESNRTHRRQRGWVPVDVHIASILLLLMSLFFLSLLLFVVAVAVFFSFFFASVFLLHRLFQLHHLQEIFMLWAA